MSVNEIVIIVGLGLNFIATIGSYINLRVSLEHRLTKLETHVDLTIEEKRRAGDKKL